MKPNKLLAVCLVTACFISLRGLSEAQVFSSNIVGYANVPIYAGDNLIANQFGNISGDSLATIFQYNIPEGATFTRWDSSQLQYMPFSIYDTNSGWSINYDLTYGEGGLFHSPTAFTNTFAGTVWPGWNLQYPFNTPLVSSNGIFLLSCFIPIRNATFYDVVGRDPLDGESVAVLNALSQLSSTTTFHNGSWNNGDPLLVVGQSAFFNLGQSSAVPEPTTCGL